MDTTDTLVPNSAPDGRGYTLNGVTLYTAEGVVTLPSVFRRTTNGVYRRLLIFAWPEGGPGYGVDAGDVVFVRTSTGSGWRPRGAFHAPLTDLAGAILRDPRWTRASRPVATPVVGV